MDNTYNHLVYPDCFYGRESLMELKRFSGSRVAVLHGGKNVLSERTQKKIEEIIKEKNGEIIFLPEIDHEPLLSDITAITKKLEAFSPQYLLGIGGGSVLDTAKAVQLTYEYPNITTEEMFSFNQTDDKKFKLKFIAIPTTSGTGSECTSVSVIIDDKTKEKRLIMRPGLLPDYVIIDPDFTDTMPSSVAAFSGMDALTHALEASISTNGSLMVKYIAINSAVDMIQNLVKSVNLLNEYSEKEREESREKCHKAASIAGVAINNSCAGLVHALDQPGAYFGIPHGMVCGLLLPYTIEYIGENDAFTELVLRLGYNSNADNNHIKLMETIKELNKKIGIPRSFSELSVNEEEYLMKLEDFAEVAINSMAAKLSPKIPTRNEAKQLLERAYYGK